MNDSWDSPYYKYDCKPYLNKDLSLVHLKYNHVYEICYDGAEAIYAIPSYISELDFMDYADYTYGSVAFSIKRLH